MIYEVKFEELSTFAIESTISKSYRIETYHGDWNNYHRALHVSEEYHKCPRRIHHRLPRHLSADKLVENLVLASFEVPADFATFLPHFSNKTFAM